MEQQVEEVTAEQPSEEPQEKAECDLHIKIPNEMRGTLKGAAELWGMAIQKKKRPCHCPTKPSSHGLSLSPRLTPGVLSQNLTEEEQASATKVLERRADQDRG